MRRNILGNFIPTITMLIIATIAYIFKFKDLLIVGVVGLIPISFLIEGATCSRRRIACIIPLILSLSVFFIIDKTILFMNDSLHIYLKYYSVAYILGYVLDKMLLILKNKIKKNVD